MNGIFVADCFHPLKGSIRAVETPGRRDLIVYTTGTNQYSLDLAKAKTCQGIRGSPLKLTVLWL